MQAVKAYVNRLIADGAYNLAMNGAFFVQPTVGTTLAFTEANKTATATQICIEQLVQDQQVI
jgi:hypothetical protein